MIPVAAKPSPTRGGDADPAPLLEARDLHKRFGAVRALNGASMQVEPGDICALLGENGAGKSTLIRALSGVIGVDSGQILVEGVEQRRASVGSRRKSGIRTVFQELSVLPDLTVAENILVSEGGPGAARRAGKRAAERAAAEVFERFEMPDVDVSARAAEISLAQRQKIEIVKALMAEPRVLILDEPTSALAPRDVEWVEGHARRVAADGAAVIYITHRLADARRLVNRIVVLRSGEVVKTAEVGELDDDELILAMLGRRVQRLYPELSPPGDGVRMSVSGLEVGERVGPLDLEVREGEILGVGALDGNGQREMMMAMAGAMPAAGGDIRVDGDEVSISSPDDALSKGVALVPEDRQGEGLLLEHPIADNLSLGILDRLRNAFGLIDRRRESDRVRDAAGRVELQAGSLRRNAGTLSGGNQQKVVLGRVLLTEPRVLLLFDCTRGVDVGTKAEIFEMMADLARDGLSVVFFSTDFSELVHMSHRVAVLVEGRVQGILAGERLSEREILRLAVAGEAGSGEPAARAGGEES